MTIGFDLDHDLDLDFSRSNIEFAISQPKNGPIATKQKANIWSELKGSNLPDSDRGDFSCRRAVDSSSYTKLLWDILVSLRPPVRPSVPRPSLIPCPLCSFYSSGWILFIFIHLIKQLQKVCRVQSFLQNCKIWSFDNFLAYTTSCLLLSWVPFS